MKSTLDDLAIFGGAPTFPEPLHVGRPNIGDRSRLFERMNDLLDRRWLTNNGRYIQEFEKRVAEKVGARNCIATCNATIALELAIRALGLRGSVIVPAFTFVATAHALQWQEIRPVFCDIDPRTHNIDPAKVEALITPEVSGILGVHLWGRACNITELSSIARRHGLKLLFDAAHAFACTYDGRSIGNFGQAEVFSFHATKFLNSFEGGAVVTNDDALADKLRLMKNFGFADYDEVTYLGTNAKMSEASAAMGLTSLESMDAFIAANRKNYERYARGLSDLPGVTLVRYDQREAANFQYLVVEIEDCLAGVSRDTMLQVLWKENILARRYFYPGCHRMEPYRSHFPQPQHNLPETDKMAGRVLSLPTGTAVGENQISKICDIVRLVVEKAAEVKARLASSQLHSEEISTLP